MIDLNNAYKFKLILTNQCNANCSYCFHDKKEKPFKNTLIQPEEMASFLPNNGKYTVTFFGGEPLVNYNYLKDFATKLKEKNQEVKFNVVTNGLLLTKEIVDTLNELEVRVTISHDAYAHEITRGTNPLKTHGDLIARIKKLGFLMTLTTLNWDLFKAFDYFEEYRQLYNREKPTVAYAGIRDMLYNIDTSLFIYNHKDFENMLDKMFIKLENDILTNNYNSYEYSAHKRIIHKIYHSLNKNMGMAPCYETGSVITFDTHGNLYSCHNADIIYGNIKDLKNATQKSFKLKSICNECEIRDLCIKCPKVVKDKEKYYCYFSKQILSRMMIMFNNLIQKGFLK